MPIWILLLAILAGLLFLAILSFCLWHFGFFTRRVGSVFELGRDMIEMKISTDCILTVLTRDLFELNQGAPL